MSLGRLTVVFAAVVASLGCGGETDDPAPTNCLYVSLDQMLGFPRSAPGLYCGSLPEWEASTSNCGHTYHSSLGGTHFFFRELSPSCFGFIRSGGGSEFHSGFELSDPKIDDLLLAACASSQERPVVVPFAYWAEWLAKFACPGKPDLDKCVTAATATVFERDCGYPTECWVREVVVRYWREGDKTRFSYHWCNCASTSLPTECDWAHPLEGRTFEYIPVATMVEWYDAHHGQGDRDPDATDAVEDAAANEEASR